MPHHSRKLRHNLHKRIYILHPLQQRAPISVKNRPIIKSNAFNVRTMPTTAAFKPPTAVCLIRLTPNNSPLHPDGIIACTSLIPQ